MSEEKRKPGRPRKVNPQLVQAPPEFESDPELKLTEMQAAFVWYYTEGACGQTEAARRAGFEFPGASSSRLLDGTPEKTGSMLWKIAETSFETGAYNAAVSAVKELNQLAGLTIQRSQNLNINANIDKMTKEDIKTRLNELLGMQDDFTDQDR